MILLYIACFRLHARDASHNGMPSYCKACSLLTDTLNSLFPAPVVGDISRGKDVYLHMVTCVMTGAMPQ